MIKKILKYCKNPSLIYLNLSYLGFFKNVPDDIHLKRIYKIKMKKDLNLENPQTFNEKVQWLKLHDRKDIYTRMVDKYEAKQLVSDIIGKEYIIPTIGLYNSFDDIDFNKMPKSFVIKCTHDSGGLIIVKDKNKLDLKSAKAKINKCLKKNYYYYGREWPYKNVRPRIIVEEYMEDKNDQELRDYKLFCFDGKFKMMFIATNRQGNGDTYFDFFDKDFNHMPFINGHPNAPILPHKPKNFDKMISLAEKISKGIPQVRVDFYDVNGKIYFGEITLSHWSGFVPFEPEEWDKKIGDWINLPNK